MEAVQNQLGGGDEYLGEPPAIVRLRISRLRSLALAFLSQFDNLGSVEPIKIDSGIDLKDEVRRFEVELIRSALECTGGNQRRAARLLKLKPTTLNAKMKSYKLIDANGLVMGQTVETKA